MPLHPQAQAFVDSLAQQNPPGWDELSPDEARQAFAGMGEFFGIGPELDAVDDMTLADVPVRVYRSDERAIKPAVIYVHGGGWVLGSIDTHDAICRRLVRGSGAHVISVDYGLAPENAFPGPLDQCFAVVQAVAEQGESLGVDPTRLLVAGDSAGGNLAAATAIRARDESGPALIGQALIYPVVAPDFETDSYQEFAEGFGLTRDSMKWFWRSYVGEGAELSQPLADLSGHSLEGLPPTLIITAEYDVLRDEGESFARRMKDSGIDVRHTRYDGMLHGFFHMATLFDDSRAATDEVIRFVRTIST